MSRTSQQADLLRSEYPDLSTLSAEEIHRLRDAILERTRKTVDPNGTGFEMHMMSDVMFNTDDMAITDWWTWVERVFPIISEAATRIGLAVIAAGGVMASAQMFATEAGSRYAGLTLTVSAGFGLWFAASAVLAAMRRR